MPTGSPTWPLAGWRDVPSFVDYMDAVFGDLLTAANRPELVGKTKTAPLPKDREREQYEKLPRLKAHGGDALHLIGARFLARYRDGDTIYLCVQTEGVNASGDRALENVLHAYGAVPALLDESTFLFLALRFRGFFRPPARALDFNSARDLVDVALEIGYTGHHIDDLVNTFSRVSIFSFNEDSVLASCHEWWLASLIATSDYQFRSELLSDDVAADIGALIRQGNINPENVYYALTSMHWKHCFLELYKCIESLHYLPWVFNLKSVVGITERGYALSRKIRSSLAWREKEDNSMKALFEMLSDTIVRDIRLSTTKVFSDLEITTVSKSAIGRRIYKIRNTLVHQEDYEDSSPLFFTKSCWPVVISYLAVIILDLYSNFSADAEFNYLIDPSIGSIGEEVTPA